MPGLDRAYRPETAIGEGRGKGLESARCELLPQLREEPLDEPTAALDDCGELVALCHLHADAGDIDVGNLVLPAVIDEIPIEADRTAGQNDFAADDGLRAVRVDAGDPERLAAETAEAAG